MTRALIAVLVLLTASPAFAGWTGGAWMGGGSSELESGTTPVTGGTTNALCRKDAAGALSCDSRLTDTGTGAITSTAALSVPASSAPASLNLATSTNTGIRFISTAATDIQFVGTSTTRFNSGIGIIIRNSDQYTFSSSSGIAAPDTGFARATTAEVKVTNGSTGYGILDANAFKVLGTKVVGQQGAAVTNPTGGTVQDVQARAAIVAILDELRAHGLIAP